MATYRYDRHRCKTLNPVAHPPWFVYEVETGKIMFRSPHQSSCIEYISYLRNLNQDKKRNSLYTKGRFA